MESSKKKRKLIISGDPHPPEEEDDIEKAKMDTFFALIEGFREARDHLLMSSGATLKQEIRKLDRREETVTVWKPCFEAEDFLEEASKAKNHAVEGSQKDEDIAEKEESKDGLDLRLSL
ncbi:uncharacterized protein LOC126688108 [Mercurialis annua]|uniref:uncharacterized protein LOC126688108 n=1 Tax=Mercurialis annua TaxID=3986 RepID=UPI0021603475|nr:uncharacterized protein LOC126688108 [Mercurialis annua]